MYLGYLATVTQLITFLFTLVGSDDQLQAVLEQQSPRDVRAEVASATSEYVWAAAFLGFGVTPQYIHNLQGRV